MRALRLAFQRGRDWLKHWWGAVLFATVVGVFIVVMVHIVTVERPAARRGAIELVHQGCGAERARAFKLVADANSWGSRAYGEAADWIKRCQTHTR